jgi:hypothetical protein
VKLPRRKFLLGALAVTTGGVALARYWVGTLADDGAAALRVICDRFIPGHDDVPGAVALGIDREIHQKMRATRSGMVDLWILTQALDDLGFAELPAAEQQRSLTAAIRLAASETPPSSARVVGEIYRECARRYLTRPEAWAALHCRAPQPHGYPDYTQCTAG